MPMQLFPPRGESRFRESFVQFGMAGLGHEYAFACPRLSACFRSNKATFVGADSNGGIAPLADHARGQLQRHQQWNRRAFTDRRLCRRSRSPYHLACGGWQLSIIVMMIGWSLWRACRGLISSRASAIIARGRAKQQCQSLYSALARSTASRAGGAAHRTRWAAPQDRYPVCRMSGAEHLGPHVPKPCSIPPQIYLGAHDIQLCPRGRAD